MNGFKVFDPDWSCRGFQYEVGKTYEENIVPDVCNRGFHFCKKAADCFNYYNFNPENKVAEIIAHGEISEEGDKCATNKIEIVREILWAELLELVNTGKADTGLCNSGNRNSGDCNSGNRNSGNRNSGNRNKTSFVAGCFNTQKHDLLFFDKPTSMTFEEWRRSDACKIMNRVDFRPADWIWENQMNDDEKAAHPEASTTGGYLKIRDNSECFREWWGGLSNREKEVIKKIPNFDPEKFKVITGIEVN